MSAPTRTPADVARACSTIEAWERRSNGAGTLVQAAVILLDEYRQRQTDELADTTDWTPAHGIDRPPPPNDTLGSFRPLKWLMPIYATLAGVVYLIATVRS